MSLKYKDLKSSTQYLQHEPADLVSLSSNDRWHLWSSDIFENILTTLWRHHTPENIKLEIILQIFTSMLKLFGS